MREAMLLTEPDTPWGTTIGLTREVMLGSNAAPEGE
jgi:hypothetical protein